MRKGASLSSLGSPWIPAPKLTFGHGRGSPVAAYCARHMKQESHMIDEKDDEELEKTKSTRSVRLAHPPSSRFEMLTRFGPRARCTASQLGPRPAEGQALEVRGSVARVVNRETAEAQLLFPLRTSLDLCSTCFSLTGLYRYLIGSCVKCQRSPRCNAWRAPPQTL